MPSAGILISISFPDVRVWKGRKGQGQILLFFWRSRPEISGRQTDIQIPCRSKIPLAVFEWFMYSPIFFFPQGWHYLEDGTTFQTHQREKILFFLS